MKGMRAGVYVRVSTADQNTESQESELANFVRNRGWEGQVYRDHGQSGAKESRPALDKLLSDARKRRLDVVVVWSMDRLARSLRHLLALTEEFRDLGIDFVSFKQQIDTSTAAGRLTYQVLGAVAEFEREILRERVRTGIRYAISKGRRVGRPPLRKFGSGDVDELKTEARKGISVRQLAIKYGTTQWMVGQILAGRDMASRKQIISGAGKRGALLQ